jgi:phosphoribosylaminoimidazole-succinocarboxamide synthase
MLGRAAFCMPVAVPTATPSRPFASGSRPLAATTAPTWRTGPVPGTKVPVPAPLVVMSTAPAKTGKPLVPVLMGSAADLPFCRKIAAALDKLGIESTLRIASAHKVPARLLGLLEDFESCGRPIVYVAVAGRSNALSGVLDCAVQSPVISCPPYSDAFGGADLFSSIRMPSGVAPALLLDPAGAALMAAKIFGLSDPMVCEAVASLQKANRDRLLVDDAAAVTAAYAPEIAAAREAGATVTETSPELVFGTSVVAVSETRNGKVRDQYDFTGPKGEKLVALVTTDRQSAFDRILAAIPFKGAVLNLTSAWWFKNTESIIPNHVHAVPHPNVTIAKRCEPFPVEFVVRGYITGSTDTSLWKNYNAGVRNYCGITFPDGLTKNQKLAKNVLTPTTKDVAGDRPIAPADVVKEGLMSQADWDICAEAALKLFEYGQGVAAEHGLILVDTKYEFGRDENGVIRIIDEVHTPDSSRFWLSTSYALRLAEGKEPENVDKEFLRLWFRDNCDPYKDATLPEAPADLVDELSRRYIMLNELITGENFDVSGSATGPGTLATAIKPFVANLVVH